MRGSVFTSEHSLSPDNLRWRFVTLRIGGDGLHPVSGTREWGMKRDGADWVFYTRGADRTTTRYR